MSNTLGKNLSSLYVIRQLGIHTDNLSSSFEKLSSGLRINKASDDAAGLAVSSSLKTDTRVFTTAIRNLNDGQSLLNVAQGALGELNNILLRQMELATQASSTTLSDSQRRVLQSESDALSREHNRIIESTEFNDMKLVDGSMVSGLRLQGGYGVNGSISMAVGQQLERIVGSGAFTAGNIIGSANNTSALATADLNNDGLEDIINTSDGSPVVRVNLSNGDGTFRYREYALTGGVFSVYVPEVEVADFNGDGIKDIITAIQSDTNQVRILYGNSDGSFRAPISMNASAGTGAVFDQTFSVGDFNGDGKDDVAYMQFAGAGRTIAVFTQQSNGTLIQTQTIADPNVSATIQAGDFNNDGRDDLFIGDYLFTSNNGTFGTSVSLGGDRMSGSPADFNNDGNLDIVYGGYGSLSIRLGNGNGTFVAARQILNTGAPIATVATETKDVNGDGIRDIVALSNDLYTMIGNGDGTFRLASTIALGIADPRDLAIVNSNSNEVPLLVLGRVGTTTRLYTQGTSVSYKSKFFDLSSREESARSLTTLNTLYNNVSKELGSLGAFQSRLSVASEVLQGTREQYYAANSRIMDIDVAEEATNLTKYSILQQSAKAILAHGKLQSELVLRLITN